MSQQQHRASATHTVIPPALTKEVNEVSRVKESASRLAYSLRRRLLFGVWRLAAAFSSDRVAIIRTAAAIPAMVLLLCGAATSAFADAGVILNESLDTSVARITGSGHSAVYLSNICPDGSPVKMRLCRPGEQGSVLSNYTTLGEDQPYEWNIVPLSIYLYGVEDPRDRPLVSSREIKAALEERYREKYLSQICTGARCRYSNSSEWREMVGATLERSMYVFVVKTSADQDRTLIAEFNSLPNVNHFNGAFRNCADFTKRVMNTYFPHSTRRDAVNDFFLTSPKAVARSFTRYAKENPDLDLRVLHFAQVPGTIKRSEECRSGTEQLYHSKKLVVPLGVLAWQAVPAVTASYILTARFNPEHEFEKNPSANAIGADDYLPPAGTEIQRQRQGNSRSLDLLPAPPESRGENNNARDFARDFARDGGVREERGTSASTGGATTGYTVSVQHLAAEEKSTRDEIVGTSDDWKTFRADLDSAEDEAIHAEIIPDRSYLKRVFAKLADGSEITVDGNGALWLSWRDDYAASQASTSADATHGTVVRVGLSASNIFAPESDTQTAYQIILARMESELRSPKHSRETALEFREDWLRLQQRRAQATAFAAPTIEASTKSHSASVSAIDAVMAISY